MSPKHARGETASPRRWQRRGARLGVLAGLALSSLSGTHAFGCGAWLGRTTGAGRACCVLTRSGEGVGRGRDTTRAGGSLQLAAVAPAGCLGSQVRKDFPLLAESVHGKPLIYLDSAATCQKPVQVLDAMESYYRKSNANVHRGAHALAVQATDLYEGARDKVAKFVNAERSEIVFTSGATDAINLVANSWGASNLEEAPVLKSSLYSAFSIVNFYSKYTRVLTFEKLCQGDEIILSEMEHHANIVPWQMVAARTGAVIKYVRLSSDLAFDLEHFRSLLSPRTKLVSVAHVSNVLGCLNPVEHIIAEAHKVGARVMLDACQSVPHMPIDVKSLGKCVCVCLCVRA